jgi:DNA-binding transcriptional LysR family regulator
MEDCPRVGWTGVELRHLEALRAVAQEMSFRGAARKLGFGQSAISQQIALLERRVGARLVDRPRGGKTVGLTPAGALLLRHAEVILDRVALAERELVLAAHGDSTALRIGVFQSVGANLLPSSLALAQRANVELQVQLVHGDRPSELLRLVACGDLDMAFAEEPPHEPSLRAHALLDDPYVLLAPAGDHSLPPEPVPLEHLAGLPLLIYDTCFHALRLETALADAGVQPDRGVRTDDAPTLHGFVAAGVGYALLPRLSVNSGDSRVAAYTVDDRLPRRTICLAWHRERELTEPMKVLLAATTQVADGLREPVAA